MPSVSVFADKPVLNPYPAGGKRMATVALAMRRECAARGRLPDSPSLPLVHYELSPGGDRVDLWLIHVADVPRTDPGADEEVRRMAREVRARIASAHAEYVSEFNKMANFLKRYEGTVDDEVVGKLLVRFKNKCAAMGDRATAAP